METKIRQITIGHIVFSLLVVFTFLFCIPSHVYAGRTISGGDPQIFSEEAVSYLPTNFLSSTCLGDDKVLVTYRSNTPFMFDTCYVALGLVDAENKTIDWGTPKLIGEDFYGGVDIVAFSSTKAVIFQIYHGNTLQYCVLDIDGTDITVGPLTNFAGGSVFGAISYSYHAAVLSSNQVVVCHEYDKGNLNYELRVTAGTVDGTEITWGSPVVFYDKNVYFTGICRITDSKFAVVWEDDAASPDAGRIRIGTVDGNTITAGSSIYDFDTTGHAVGAVGVTALSEDRIAITWEDDTDSGVPIIRLASVSGTSVTLLGTATTLSGSVSNDLYISALSNSEAIVAMNGGSENNSLYFLCTLSGDTFDSSSGTIIADYQANDAMSACLTSDLFVISYIDDNGGGGSIKNGGRSIVYTVSAGSNPEINVQGNGVDIECGDNTPSTADYTDFGTGATLSSTFTIQNLGLGTLTLGADAVTITGTDAANFSVDTQPATTVSGSSSTTFVIDFASASATIHSAEIHINSDDIHEPDYFFSIQATGASTPDITFINGANASLNYQQSFFSLPQSNWPFGQFSLAGDATGTTLSSVTVTLGGSYSESDFGTNPFTLYASATNNFGTASSISSNVAYADSGSDITFSGLSDAIPSGTRYYWVTADVSATATGGDHINGTIDAAEDLSISGGALSGSSSYGKLNAGEDATLPVELSSFTAIYANDFVTIQWATASETDVHGFNIYRSSEDNFTEAKQVNVDLIPGHGTTTQPNEYSFPDESADASAIYYYWLESVDYGGTTGVYGSIRYDPPVDVDGDGQLDTIIHSSLNDVFPNPVRVGQSVTFEFMIGGLEGKMRPVSLNIYDIKGRLVQEVINEDRMVNDYSENWHVNDLANGVYFYQLKTANYQETKKLIIQ